MRPELRDLEVGVASGHRRAPSVEDVYTLEGKIPIFRLHKVRKLRHDGATQGMPTAIRNIVWEKATGVAILLFSPLRTAEPAAQEDQHIIANIATCLAVSTSQRGEHASFHVIDKYGEVIAGVDDTQVHQLLPELRIIVFGSQQCHLDALVAGQHPGHVRHHPRVATAEAATTSRRAAAAAATTARIASEGMHWQPCEYGLQPDKVIVRGELAGLRSAGDQGRSRGACSPLHILQNLHIRNTVCQ
mmetsp:Transcript_32227/g.92760  ORF Transcript_32227/g.92760 Transcript_32227/m.92760 type:complete len:245 (+) Transcript_32227:547-1281(+)